MRSTAVFSKSLSALLLATGLCGCGLIKSNAGDSSGDPVQFPTDASATAPDGIEGANRDDGDDVQPDAADRKPRNNDAGSTSDAACGPGSACDEPPPGAPEILNLSTNTDTLVRGGNEKVRITAVVTDPDGIADLIGGSLEAPSGAGTYGSFATAAGEGSYQIDLTWREINDTKPITFGSGGGARTFEAVFYDQAGNEVRESLTLEFRCTRREDALCAENDYACTNLATEPNHCSACGRNCEDVVHRTGVDRSNLRFEPDFDCTKAGCLVGLTVERRSSCNEICGYLKCERGAAYAETAAVTAAVGITCNELPPRSINGSAFESLYCLCRE